MVAKKFILQIANPVALTILSRKMEVMRIQTITPLQGEIGGKVLSTIKSLSVLCMTKEGGDNGNMVNNPKVWPELMVFSFFSLWGV